MSTACVSWKSSSQCLAVCQWVSRYKLKCTKKMVLTTTPSQGVLSFLLCLLFGLCQPCRVGIVVYEGTGLGWCSICIWICAWICIYFDFVGKAGQGMCSVRRNRSYPVLQALTALPRHTLVSWGLSPRSVHPVISDFFCKWHIGLQTLLNYGSSDAAFLSNAKSRSQIFSCTWYYLANS